MKFYKIKYGKKLHSFDDEIGDSPILGTALKVHQNNLIKSQGGQLITVSSQEGINDSKGYFVFNETLFFSDQFLIKAIQATKNHPGNLRFCLNENSFNNRYVLPFKSGETNGNKFAFYYINGKGPHTDVFIDQKVHEYHLNIPSQIVRGGRYDLDACDTFAMEIISPFHLLFANLAQNIARTVRQENPITSFFKKNFVDKYPFWYYKALRSMNKIGKNCKIHPTAVIEASVIGDNVQIGAHAVVRLSVLENDCYVSDNVGVINSYLAQKTFIATCNYVNSCVTYPEVFLIHGPYQFSVFGENSACFAVINCDLRLDQETIKIPTSEGLIDSKQSILGIAYGHRSKTAGGNIIAAGRIVPNDLVINPPDNIILKFEDK